MISVKFAEHPEFSACLSESDCYCEGRETPFGRGGGLAGDQGGQVGKNNILVLNTLYSYRTFPFSSRNIISALSLSCPMNHFLFLPQKQSQHCHFLIQLTISATFPFSPQKPISELPFLVPGSLRLRSLERCTSGRRCHPCQTQQPPSASPGGSNLKSSFVLGRTPNVDTIEAL